MTTETSPLLRVVLDTSVARAAIYGDEAAEALERLDSNASVSLCLANNAVPELVLALLEGRIAWSLWTARVSVLDRLLDPTWPVFPSDREMPVVNEVSSPQLDRRASGPHTRAIWDLLRKSTSSSDLEEGPPFVGSDGGLYHIRSSRLLAESLIAGHRSAWKSVVADVQRQVVGYRPTQEYIAELFFTGLFGGSADERLLRDRHDGYVRAFARFIYLALGEGSRYRADSKGRRGDSFDLEMLQALAAPALICTLDERLRSHVAESGSQKAAMLVNPRELLAGIQEGTIRARLGTAWR
jgi:hypothetical protein